MCLFSLLLESGGKWGLGVAAIHTAVPGLNASLGRSIDTLLARLTPGSAWFRHNWGLSRSAERNQHPSRSLPRLDAGVTLEEVHLRVEHQALVALPESGGILFAIRIASHPLTDVRRDPEASSRLVRALRTMPADVAAYKGLADARGRIAALMPPPFC
ncbi:MAG: heme-dependent oxidative N-demethylase subunit alpha family protein [Verrucomicrobiota bacterium]